MSKNTSKTLTGAVMVCGGGIAGIQSALDLANSGFKVYLIENSPSIGGKMAQLDKTFPTGDCATCIISPKLVEATRNLNIEILTQSDVEEVTGTPGNFKVKLRQNARFVEIAKCNACGDCEKVCPVRVPDSFNRGLSTTPAIHKITAQAVPNAYVIEKRKRPPCQSACPIDQNAQAYIALIGQGKFAEAAEIIRQDNPLPLICGYVCHRPCESECQASRYGEAVSIRALKRFAIESQPTPQPPPSGGGGAAVAIVGSGPSGLGAADWLARKGYAVTIFEALPVPGGMMRIGIPDFRLPREVLDREVQAICDLGVDLKCNSPIGKDLTIQGLLKDYKAVFIGVGAQNSSTLGIEGEDLQGVRPGIEFIRRANMGEPVKIGDRVAVIGAGNAAMDIARTAKRLGAKEVTIVYRRTKREMPADPVEVQDAINEGVKIILLTNPKRFVGKDGRLTGIECLKMELSKDKDASGRRRPIPVEGSEHIMEFDEAILATGQVVDMDFCQGTNLEPNKWGLLKVDPVTLATDIPGVFAGGDVVAGAGTLSEAVAAGRRAAESIDRFINGADLAEGRSADPRIWTEEDHLELEKIHKKERFTRHSLGDGGRPKSIRVEAGHDGFTAEQAVAEAQRCLACGICCECMECVKVCGPRAIDHEMIASTREIEVGAVILSPGYEEFDARLRGEFGFGRYPNVVTNIQFERILSASGPFGGHVQRPSDGQDAERIGFIQCVGSRDAANDRPYCSSVCCMAAIKEAVVAQGHTPGLEATIFYTDIRAFGKDFDRYYERAKADGVRFIRGMVSRVVEMPGSKELRISYIHDGKPVDEVFDLVVLSTGIKPSAAALALADRVGVEINECGFCRSDEASVVTSREGVFAAGAFQEPKDIPETVAQASAAAAAAMELLAPARGSLVTEKVYPPEHDFTDARPRIGVFVCHCGINIAGVVDVEKVSEEAKKLPFVEFAETQVYACADNTQDRIKEIINEHKLNRLIVASCTPRTHEALFRETARECGLNPFLVDMANIRDQCSWVHSNEPEAATEKSIELLRMAVGRASRLASLTTEEIPVTQAALVLGGGPSGMTAALSLANQGFRVHLAEKTDKLGGRHPNETLIDKVTNHPLISVYLNSKLAEINGHIGNFTSTLTDGTIVEHGVLLVATGGIEYSPVEYSYGQDSKVITQRELEKHIAEGSLKLPDKATVAMIQCVGSRTNDRPFCSRVCCIDAVKNAIKIKKSNPDASVVVFYRDMRTYGMNELHYQAARELGVLFVRYDPENPPSYANGTLTFTEPELGLPVTLKPDLLVLSAGMSPAVDNLETSELAKVPLNNDGFFLEAHVKLRPVDFASEGIFLAGSAHSPKTTAENMQQGRAAAGRAATIVSRKTLVVGGQVSHVDVRKCVSCLTCIKVCPYNAPEISMSNGKNRVEIQAAKCMGCGSCAAECPAKAIQLWHFTDHQVAAAIQALLSAVSEQSTVNSEQ